MRFIESIEIAAVLLTVSKNFSTLAGILNMYEPLWFQFGIMIDTTKLQNLIDTTKHFILILVYVTLALI